MLGRVGRFRRAIHGPRRLGSAGKRQGFPRYADLASMLGEAGCTAAGQAKAPSLTCCNNSLQFRNMFLIRQKKF